MQLRKTYLAIKTELLFDELRDLVLKQGAILRESKMETYALPDDSSAFITRGTLAFGMPASPERICCSLHLIGSARTETKLLADFDDSLFSPEKQAALQDELDFMLGTYEVKPCGGS